MEDDKTADMPVEPGAVFFDKEAETFIPVSF
jgi:hypothetical protein